MKAFRIIFAVIAAAILIIPTQVLAGSDPPPPTGFSTWPSVHDVTTDTARITWRTHNASTATIRLSLSSNMSGSVAHYVSNRVNSHSVTLGGLTVDEVYYYTVTADGQTSGAQSFTTQRYINTGSSVTEYKRSWYYQALQYQNQIDLHAPLGKAAFITTHNSYNAGVYSQNGSYIDPNQNLSIYDQLQVGVRAIELDVHYTFSSSGFWPWEWSFSEELKLCHGNGDTGCHPNDRYFTQGLSEVRSWLNANPDQVLIIYLEDHMEGQYDKAISEMNGIIGDLVYKPNGCQTLPMSLTKNAVLSAGKNILLIGGNCGSAAWSNYVYKNHFSSTENLENFQPYPACDCGDKDVDYVQSHLVRIYEDRTTLSALFGDPGPPITAGDAAAMAKCGVGAIGMDKLNAWDSRLSAQIWSWGTNEPNDWGAGEDCAVQRWDGRFNDIACGNRYPVAAWSPSTEEWYITSGTYTFSEAPAAVQNEFPGWGLVFGVPVNGYQNAELHRIKSLRGISNVWINYSDQWSEGDWYPGY